jgi:hypothetical protein
MVSEIEKWKISVFFANTLKSSNKVSENFFTDLNDGKGTKNNFIFSFFNQSFYFLLSLIKNKKSGLMAKPQLKENLVNSKRRPSPSKPKRAVEKIGLIPRSIIRTSDRFRKQLLPGQQGLDVVIQEFRISRYQVRTSLQCLLNLIFIPLFINFFMKTYVLIPLVEFFWNNQHKEIFLNSYQKKLALAEMQDFEDSLYFDFLIAPEEKSETIFSSNVITNKFDKIYQLPFSDHSLSNEVARESFFQSHFQEQFQQKTMELALSYNQQSIDAINNLLGDLITFATIFILFKLMRVPIIILKSFIIESFFSFNDTLKSFLLILGIDLLVGFHSPRGWEVLFGFLLNRFGLPHSENFIFLLVATVPVILDVFFKYWVFRYLSQISPSTVATYHAMRE